MSSKLCSVNVGLPREVTWGGKQVRTSIWKAPVEGRVPVTKLNLRGDQQSDLSVHGGFEKAVYAYPSEHYGYWREALALEDLSWGAFGENLTVAGLFEDEVRIGDRLRIGSVELVVTQPRMPCFKLGIRFDRADMPKLFLASRRPGFYCRVEVEGDVGAGDPIEYVQRQDHGLTVAAIVDLYTGRSQERDSLQQASELAALPAAWREHFRGLL